MVVISVSITESSEQVVAGFPRTISLSTNVPATIFYTIDGSTPTSFSSVYVSAVNVPFDVLEFTLKAYATNGVDASAVVEASYSSNISEGVRLPHSSTRPLNHSTYSLYPFGSQSLSENFDYINNAESGITVRDPSSPVIPYGYDAEGNPVGANQEINTYLNVYSTTDSHGRVYNGVGTLPGQVTVTGRRSALEYSPQESSRDNKLFNPKAMVIFQDSTTEDPSLPLQINPQLFSLQNVEITSEGAPLRAVGPETPTITGSFLRSHYNPKTQMITSYYRDSATNRWIISSYPYTPTDSDPGNLSGMVFGKHDQGPGRVFTWNLFRYSILS